MRVLTLMVACSIAPVAAVAAEPIPYIVCEGPGYHLSVPVYAAEDRSDPYGWSGGSVFHISEDRWVSLDPGIAPFGDINPEAWEHFTSGKAECYVAMD